MSDRTLRYLIAGAVALLLIHQIGSLIAAAFGIAWGVVSSAVVAAITLLAARQARAGGRTSFWFLLPTLLFTVVPTAVVTWRAFTAETSAWERIADFAPFLVGFAAPMALLLLVYYELRRRTRGDQAGRIGS
jgi:hypothetical protein